MLDCTAEIQNYEKQLNVVFMKIPLFMKMKYTFLSFLKSIWVVVCGRHTWHWVRTLQNYTIKLAPLCSIALLNSLQWT